MCITIAVFYGINTYAQTIDLKGKIIAGSELESIHVLNISAQKFAVTNANGEFEIPAKLNDTILISSIQYIPQNFIVSKTSIELKFIAITLTDRVNELDEVIVGKILTGTLLSDVENSDAKRDINFYDLGIPGYTGKRKTLKEQKLYEADAGKSVVIAPLFIGVNFHKILNKISGRTKKLKRAVTLEAQNICMNRAKSDFSELLFGEQDIEEHLIIEFFYYASEDPEFLDLCNTKNSMLMYEFLLKKLYLFTDEDANTKE